MCVVTFSFDINTTYSSTSWFCFNIALFPFRVLLSPLSLPPVRGKAKAAVCVITWPISHHPMHKKWEWGGGAKAGDKMRRGVLSRLCPCADSPLIWKCSTISMLMTHTLTQSACHMLTSARHREPQTQPASAASSHGLKAHRSLNQLWWMCCVQYHWYKRRILQQFPLSLSASKRYLKKKKEKHS